jgi:hypothetical protein
MFFGRKRALALQKHIPEARELLNRMGRLGGFDISPVWEYSRS